MWKRVNEGSARVAGGLSVFGMKIEAEVRGEGGRNRRMSYV